MNTEIVIILLMLLGQLQIGLIIWLSIKHRKHIQKLQIDLDKRSRFSPQRQENTKPREEKTVPKKRNKINWEY